MTLTPYRMNLAAVAIASVLVLPVSTGHAESAPLASWHRPGGAAGNLVVVVPPIPRHGQLHRLCHALVEAPKSGRGAQTARFTLEAPEVAGNSPTESASGIRLLTDATGGTHKAAVSWCRNFLHPPGG